MSHRKKFKHGVLAASLTAVACGGAPVATAPMPPPVEETAGDEDSSDSLAVDCSVENSACETAPMPPPAEDQ